VGIENRADFRAALSSVLVSRQEHLPIFEHAFDLFWRNPRLLEQRTMSLLPKVFARSGELPPPPPIPARLAQAMWPAVARVKADGSDELRLVSTLTLSEREVLQQKHFETMTGDELAAIRRMLG